MNAGYRVLAADDLAALAKLRTNEEKRQAILGRLQEIRSQYLPYTALPPQPRPVGGAGPVACKPPPGQDPAPTDPGLRPVDLQHPHLRPTSTDTSWRWSSRARWRAAPRLCELASVLDRLSVEYARRKWGQLRRRRPRAPHAWTRLSLCWTTCSNSWPVSSALQRARTCPGSCLSLP